MSVPVYHYFDIGRLGRGEVVNLFLKDAGVKVTEKRYPMDGTWSENSEKLKQQGISRTGQVPALEYKGFILTQHIPTLRYLAADLGAYDGETQWEKYIVDAVSDVYVDWRSKWAANLSNKTEEYKNSVPGYHEVLAKYYSDFPGPYLLGNKITYADFAVYQSLDNDKRTGTLPAQIPESLVKLQEAIEKRPNIADYLKATSA